ncbi:MAG: hypothetical protein A2X12_08780 [Bacteroidetes bacterium GWE2_29_8]|nr:MAG: hypothetical protein A2X12_08780 [Bacteroidetes bacterium GWE2_29_8]OFY18350.1 MAG: hypothetical protein A2X02_08410 [Bacteroidetes bacterium GWF2_29_10]
MKNLVISVNNSFRGILIALFILISGMSYSQKFAYVNTEYILENIPEYSTAQTELDNLSVQWQKDIEMKLAEIDKMYKSYQADQILLPEELKRKRENEITKKEKEVKDLQKKKFGKDGELFKKRQELVKPIQDKLYKAIEDLSKKGSYAFIFDKAGQVTMLFADPKLDKSDEVLQNMGYKAGKKEKSK